MAEILSRLGAQQAKGSSIMFVNGGRHPQRGIHTVLPRKIGGVLARVVLSNVGIKSRGLVKMTAHHADVDRRGMDEAARRKAAKEAEEKRRAAIKAETEKEATALRTEPIKVDVSSDEKKPKVIEEHGYRADNPSDDEPKVSSEEKNVGITEAEERLADLLGAAQEMKPLADEVLGKAKAEETSQAETEKCDERGVIIPELPLGEPTSVEKPRKKRGRKGKRAKAEATAVWQES